MENKRSTENRYADWLANQKPNQKDPYYNDYRAFQTFVLQKLDEIRREIVAQPVKGE